LYGSKVTRVRPNRDVTLPIKTLSGRSIVLAIVITTNRAEALVGQSSRLYITSCRFVHNKSSYKNLNKESKNEWNE